MRFYDDTKYYHFSTSPTTDDAERVLIVQERLEYAKEMMTDAFKPEGSIGKTIYKLSVPIVFSAIHQSFYIKDTLLALLPI